MRPWRRQGPAPSGALGGQAPGRAALQARGGKARRPRSPPAASRGVRRARRRVRGAAAGAGALVRPRPRKTSWGRTWRDATCRAARAELGLPRAERQQLRGWRGRARDGGGGGLQGAGAKPGWRGAGVRRARRRGRGAAARAGTMVRPRPRLASWGRTSCRAARAGQGLTREGGSNLRGWRGRERGGRRAGFGS